MERPKSSNGQASLFQVYLRLRPPIRHDAKQESFLCIEPPEGDESFPTHITVQPPNDARKRAVEKFAFTKVFEEETTQLDVFQESGMPSLINAVLLENRDSLVATLGVTGSGKSHTILGSKTQRGITQMSLDIIFRSLESTIQIPDDDAEVPLLDSIAASDSSEAQLYSAEHFLEIIYGDGDRGRISRAQTPMSRSQTPMVGHSSQPIISALWQKNIHISNTSHPAPEKAYREAQTSPFITQPLGYKEPSYNTPRSSCRSSNLPSQLPFWNRNNIARNFTKVRLKDSFIGSSSRRPHLPRVSILPQDPDTSDIKIPVLETDQHVVLISMYEVYNDRIFDLLSPASQVNGTRAANNQKDRRRPLLFKSTEGSADRKVVAGLRKVVCSTYEEALMVLETGLTERRVTGTESNSVSSRSHGFFCVEVKRKVRDRRHGHEIWVGNAFTIVDLAGSERARNAKTAGATLAEAGKINESLMYLGQCLQMQSDLQDGNKALVPFRQCKLTELLFSNSFPSSNHTSSNSHPRNTQRAVMLVMADPLGDFNATSQMLRYSALAREVTVPRIPSITSTILSTTPAPTGPKPATVSKSQAALEEQLELAALEIAHISDEYDALAVRFSQEEVERIEAELKLKAAEERCLLIEQEVREDCWAEMEERMEKERRRWQAALEEESSRNENHLDMKLDLLSRGIKIHEDPKPDSVERINELEAENDALRRKIELLERELLSRSPTKKTRSKKNTIPGRFDSMDYSFTPANESDIENSQLDMKKFNMKSSPLAQTGKPKKLTTRQWDLAPEGTYD
ncbi:putative succinate--hydroxymethylglutarate CoA-transferase [Microsporum canis]|uniref:Kinesin family protein n=1 Tax=Arthroderma otae (strain ATCC MYA-4605 / CBS 113480) TaxID=554155 RepID=C5FQ59_ARTOC|nr:kinesin family protein [Microsporum canis CBS 113480]EEQ32012.1 kinesin family protein [Microsporum canis CBS 113480]